MFIILQSPKIEGYDVTGIRPSPYVFTRKVFIFCRSVELPSAILQNNFQYFLRAATSQHFRSRGSYMSGLKACNIIKKTPTRMFSYEYCEIFKKSFFYRTPPGVASGIFADHVSVVLQNTFDYFRRTYLSSFIEQLAPLFKHHLSVFLHNTSEYIQELSSAILQSTFQHFSRALCHFL